MLAAYMSEVQNCVGAGAAVTEAAPASAAAAPPETVDKQTNTECAFLPSEKQRNRFQVAISADSANAATATTSDMIDERMVKRSQTFSPSVSKNRYMCRLNRSDSDSAMHFGVLSVQHSFQRGAIERRSLRLSTKVPKSVSSSKFVQWFFINFKIIYDMPFVTTHRNAAKYSKNKSGLRTWSAGSAYATWNIEWRNSQIEGPQTTVNIQRKQIHTDK